MAVVLLMFTACATTNKSVGTSQTPAAPWIAPAGAVPQPQRSESAGALPENIAPGSSLSLAQVVDIALSNNPATRVAWLQARAAEANLGIRESQYLPEVDLSVNATTTHSVSGGGSTVSTTTAFGPSAALNYLLFDFGGRAASVEEGRQLLIASNFLHNQAIQDVILRTEQAYYSYLDARALVAAQDATLKERQAELSATEARHNAGIATIADVLQARTALSQAQLNRESIAGSLRTFEGTLATSMGLPATVRFEFGQLPPEIPATRVRDAVEALIARAVAERPDLAASRARALAAQQRVTETRSAYLPTIGVTSMAGQTWFSGRGPANPYSVGIGLRWPVFTGFRNVYDVRAAQAEAEIAREDVRALEQQVDLQVWTSYFALQTAEARLTTARDLLASAQPSADVATSRYRAGVGSILDVLTAESALEGARAQEVQARADWFLSVAQLAHDTGTLERLSR